MSMGLALVSVLIRTTGIFQVTEVQDSCVGEIALDSIYQVQIQKDLPTTNVRIVERESRVFEDNNNSPESSPQFGHCIVLTYDGPHSSLSDTIPWMPSQGFSNVPDVEFVDLNFDGYLDIHISHGEDVGSADNFFWMYSRHTMQFTYSAEMSSFFANSFSCNEEDSTLEAGSTWCGHQCYYINVYQWRNGVLTLVGTKSNEQTGGGFIYTREKLMNGQMVVVEQDTTREASH